MAGDQEWFYADGGNYVGPMGFDELKRRLTSAGGASTLVYGPGLASWVEARHVPGLGQSAEVSESPPPPPTTGRRSDEIDYEIFGSEMQYVEITLDPGEMVLAEAGSLMYMTLGIRMDTVFGDPSAPSTGLMGKMFAAGKRLLTGESLFMTTFTNEGPGRRQVAFAAPYPGKIVPIDLAQMQGEIICQKDAFLCAARGVQIGIAFQKKIGVALFGGEGFIMQRLTGDGLALLHAGGTLVRRTLAAGQTLRLDTGCLVAITSGVRYEIEWIGGIKNSLFGGEGLFFATLTGPGDVWLQSLPFSRLAGRVLANAPGLAGGTKDEGGMLFRGLRGLIDGDNSA